MNKMYFESHNIEVSMQTFTPSYANRVLSKINVGNRKISKQRVAEYKKDMLSGNWRFNGDSIRVNDAGILIDGQHRLTAVVESGVSCEFLVIKGIATSAKHTIDTGKGRTGGDALAIQAGVPFKESHTINGALCLFEKYKLSGFTGAGGGTKLSTSESLRSYNERKTLIDSSFELMKDCLPMRGLLLQKSEVLFLFMVFCEIDSTDAKIYMSKILTGVEVSLDSVELHIRNIMLDVKMGSSKHNRKILINSVLKCWNVIRRGGKIKHKSSCLWKPVSESSVIAK